jgi:HME family heavy-metal exporter
MFDALAPGKEILHPVAITIFGGLVSATALDAFVTPALFLMFGRKSFERLLTDRRASAPAPLAQDALTPATF